MAVPNYFAIEPKSPAANVRFIEGLGSLMLVPKFPIAMLGT